MLERTVIMCFIVDFSSGISIRELEMMIFIGEIELCVV